MRMNVRGFVLAALVLSPLISAQARETKNRSGAQAKEAVDYIDPFIGTGHFGKTFPGAATPGGMVQLSPDTITC